MHSTHLATPGRGTPVSGRRAARRSIPALLVAAFATALLSAGVAGAATAAIGLGTADSFAVLAGSGITNTGPTTITGDIGTHPTPAIVGLGTVTLNGTNHADDAVTAQAKIDLTTAYNQAAAAAPQTAVATELGGLTLTPGVYNSATLGLTGTLTLDTQGDPNAVFVFQAGTTLITASGSSVVILGGGTACNVFWQVGSSATLGTNSSLIGTVLAATSITATTGATIQGRLLAQVGAVTLDTNTITRVPCAAPTTTTTAPATGDTGTPTGGSTGTDTTGGSGGSGGSGTPGDSTTSGARPPTLAFTGTDVRIPIAGGLALATGLGLLVASGGLRRRPAR